MRRTIATIGLALGKPDECRAQVIKGQVTVSLPAQQLVIVYRNGANDKVRLLPKA